MSPPRDKPLDKGLPHNWETERSVLGGLLLAPERLADVRELLVAEDFHRPAHQTLYALLCELADREAGHDLIGATDAIDARSWSERVGGIAYVCALPQACPSIDLLDRYALAVKETSTRRAIAELGGQLDRDARDGVRTGADLVEQAERALFALGVRTGSDDAVSVAEALRQAGEELATRIANPDSVQGIPTGYKDLDRKLAGLHRTDLVVLAARPAMGKTALALNLAIHAARPGHGVALFSLEMSRGQLVTRMACSEGRLDATKVRTGELDHADQGDWARAVESLSRLPIYIDDTPGLTLAQLRTKARRIKARHPEVALLIIDYLQLMQGSGRKGANRENEISEISRGLKVLAKELDVCVLALSQLNRSLEARQDKRPLPSDLRESGAIEQDADVILFIYRDEVYHKDASPKKGIAEVIIAKQRSGPIGTVELAFIDKWLLFQGLYRLEGEGQQQSFY